MLNSVHRVSKGDRGCTCHEVLRIGFEIHRFVPSYLGIID